MEDYVLLWLCVPTTPIVTHELSGWVCGTCSGSITGSPDIWSRFGLLLVDGTTYAKPKVNLLIL